MVHGGLVGAKVRTLALIALIAGCFIAIAVYSHGAVHPLMNAHMVKSLFQSIVWEAFPFILLGAMLSSIIETWVGSNHLSALLSDSLSGRMTASIMGLVVPVCDCGTIPVARSLRRKGVGESVAFTFALGTPTINLVALISTFIAFHQQWSWVLLRAGAALIIAIVTGIAVHFREEGLLEKWNAVHPNHDHQDVKGLSKWRHATDHSIEELFAVGPFFVISALFAAIAQGLWPMHAVTTFTQHSVWSIVLLMILGSAFSLCSEADAFVAASLTTIFSPGAVMAFLLAGQMIDVRNLMLMPQVFSKKTMAVGLPLTAVMIFSVALLVNRFFTGGGYKMLSEKKLQFGILLLYGVSLSHLVWTGTMYQYIGSVMAPFEVVACIVLWVLIVMSVFSLRKKEPDHVHDPWLQGILFAAFALPPATYLITTLIGW